MFEFSEKIIDWYGKNKRDLPWRKSKNPYRIWLSEVILQQTRVAQGLPYYYSFLENFPTVYDLANASEDEVLFVWKGLGYYSRARNLHKTAKIVVFDFGGEFPASYQELLKLKGVGEYTAAAIASFCFDESLAVVDGNVYRVLSRIFNISEPIDTGQGKKTFKALANELIDEGKPATFNQAIMEFGALQCVPKNPNCEVCPFLFSCQAKAEGSVDVLPIKSKKLLKKSRYFNYFIIEENEKWAIVQRGEKDIWTNLYEFPLIETSCEVIDEKELRTKAIVGQLFEFDLIYKNGYKKHLLTHQDIYFSFWKVKLKSNQHFNFRWCAKQELFGLAFPKLLENYLVNM